MICTTSAHTTYCTCTVPTVVHTLYTPQAAVQQQYREYKKYTTAEYTEHRVCTQQHQYRHREKNRVDNTERTQHSCSYTTTKRVLHMCMHQPCMCVPINICSNITLLSYLIYISAFAILNCYISQSFNDEF